MVSTTIVLEVCYNTKNGYQLEIHQQWWFRLEHNVGDEATILDRDEVVTLVEDDERNII